MSLETCLNPVTVQGVLSLLGGNGAVAGRVKYNLMEKEEYALFDYVEVGYRMGDPFGQIRPDRLR